MGRGEYRMGWTIAKGMRPVYRDAAVWVRPANGIWVGPSAEAYGGEEFFQEYKPNGDLPMVAYHRPIFWERTTAVEAALEANYVLLWTLRGAIDAQRDLLVDLNP